MVVATSMQAQIEPLKRENRTVWLTTLGGMDWPRAKATSEAKRQQQQQELCRILDQYKELHINTVLLQTRVRGTTIYPSDIEGWDQCMTGAEGKHPGYDPLQFALDECHKRGMELHCWLVTIPSGSVKTHQNLGAKSVTKTHPEISRKIKNYWYLDPGHPNTKTYLASICREIVSRYDVDGIHFDFIRYPENSADAVDRLTWKQYGEKTGMSRADWRRSNITACVEEMYRTVKALKPWVKVTAAPLGKYSDTARYPAGNWNGLNRVYQDAQLWMRTGIIDGVFPMLYHSDLNFYPFVLDWKENSYGRPVTIGLGIYFLHPREGKWTLPDIQRQMNYCRSVGLSVAHYRSQFLTENTKGLYDWCRDAYYTYPALTSALTWQTKQAPTAPEQLQVSDSQLSWSAVKDPEYDTYVTYNVYRSTQAPVNIEDPANLYAARLLDNQLAIPPSQEKYYYAVTAMDRIGNESQPVQSTNLPQLASDVSYQNGWLQLPANAQAKEVLVCDLTQRILLQTTYAEKVDVSQLQAGSYIVNFVTASGRSGRIGIFLK